MDFEDDNIETVWIELVFRSSANILICMLYRPLNAPINWLEYFHSALDKAYNENKEMLALGDINIDFLNHIEHTEKTSNNCRPNEKTDHKAVKLNHILTDLNLHQIVKKPSRVTSTSKTLIDHIYVFKFK